MGTRRFSSSKKFWTRMNRDELASSWASPSYGRAIKNRWSSGVMSMRLFPHFAALVLVAHVSGAVNEATAFGASVFFCARVVHALVYLAGVPWVRTAAFFAGLVGEGIILGQVIRAAA